MLANLTNRQNIHNLLNLKQVEYPLLPIVERYEEIKNSNFYNHSADRWNRFVCGNEVTDLTLAIDAQFFEILIELEINPQNAKRAFKDLRANAEHKKCAPLLGTSLSLELTHRTYSRLLNLMVVHKFYPDKALEEYQKLLESDLFDKETSFWKEGDFLKEHRAETQILDELLKFEMNQEYKWKSISDFAGCSIYNKEKELWFAYQKEDGTRATYHLTKPQLTSLLLEIELDPKMARDNLLRLKSMDFYDGTGNFWYQGDTLFQIIDTKDLDVGTQLLSILVELRLAKKLQSLNRPSEVPELPKVRNF